MSTRFSKDELRQKRRQLYQDPVFLATHEALRPLLRSFDIVELFIRAEQFTLVLLAHPPIERSLMEYEVADLRDDLVADGYEVADSDDFLLLLILSLVNIYALRHILPCARVLLGVLLPFCREYHGFKELLGKFVAKEHQLQGQGKMALQKSPRLLAGTLSQQPPALEVKAFVACLVSNCECLSPDSMERILVPLMATNEQYGHVFDEEVNRLKEKLGMKTTTTIQPLVQGDLVMEKRVEHEVNGVEKGGAGIVIKKMA